MYWLKKAPFNSIVACSFFLTVFSCENFIQITQSIFTSSSQDIQEEQDNFRILWSNPPNTLDPRFALDANSQYLTDILHCRLFSFDENGQLTPEVADTWKIEANKLSFTINKKWTFSDGSPVDEVVVVENLRYFISPDSKSTRKYAYKDIEKVDLINREGKTVIELTFLEQIEASFLSNLSIGLLKDPFSDEKKWPERSDHEANCGPYELRSQDLNSLYLELRKDAPKDFQRPKVKIMWIQDELTRVSMLMNGEADFMQNGASIEKLNTIIKRSERSFELKSKAGLNVSYIGFNFNDPIVSQKIYRQMIQKALNREELVQYLASGHADEALSFFDESNPFYSSLPSLDKNENLGAPPKGLKLTTTSSRARIALARAIKYQLNQHGIELELEVIEWGRFKKLIAAGQVQMWLMSWVGYKDPDILRYVFSSESWPPHGGNRGQYKNEKLDDLLVKASRTHDFSERKRLYDQAQLIVHDELPYVFIWHEPVLAIVRKEYKNVKLYADGRIRGVLESRVDL